MANIEKLKIILKSIIDNDTMVVNEIEDLSTSEQEIIETLYKENLVENALEFLSSIDTDEEWSQIMNKMQTSKEQVFPFWKTLLKYAAIFIGLISLGFLVYINENPQNPVVIEENVITLKMGKNTVKVINQGENQQIVSPTGQVLGEQIGNKIKYNADARITELIYNEVEIPFGKILDVELSDGTLVHLNSGTKMRYPVKFLNDKKRKVFIEGEAYFKVAKDVKHPFVVQAEEVAIEVLGTEFNVSSYKEDNAIKTVLVEGSVRMSNSIVPNDNVVLTPGTQGAWNKTSHVTEIEDVDVDLFTGWMNGELLFKRTTFATMTKKLERSYNVTIHNNNALLEHKILNARFNVNIETIEDVMKSISEIHPFTYEMQNRIIKIN